MLYEDEKHKMLEFLASLEELRKILIPAYDEEEIYRNPAFYRWEGDFNWVCSCCSQYAGHITNIRHTDHCPIGILVKILLQDV